MLNGLGRGYAQPLAHQKQKASCITWPCVPSWFLDHHSVALNVDDVRVDACWEKCIDVMSGGSLECDQYMCRSMRVLLTPGQLSQN